MNEADIDKMDAGPEMDALVAEQVMGWEFVPGDWENRHYWLMPGGPRDDSVKAPPPYSRDIAAAWQVVERVRVSPMLDFRLFADAVGYHCRFGSYPGHANTAPEAICRAALKAVFKTEV